MLKYEITPVTAFMQNCTLVWCDQSHEAVLIDPGGDSELLKQVIAKHQVTLSQILLTHGHIDHVAAAKELAAYYQVKIIGPHHADKFWLDALPMQSQHFGLPTCLAFTPDDWLNEGQTICLGNETLHVYHCPGHTPGHVIFHNQAAKLAIVGDVLFKGSIGRTDFPLGSYDDLLASIKNKLWPLGDDVTFIAGHGPISTFGEERRNNPYVGNQAN